MKGLSQSEDGGGVVLFTGFGGEGAGAACVRTGTGGLTGFAGVALCECEVGGGAGVSVVAVAAAVAGGGSGAALAPSLGVAAAAGGVEDEGEDVTSALAALAAAARRFARYESPPSTIPINANTRKPAITIEKSAFFFLGDSAGTTLSGLPCR